MILTFLGTGTSTGVPQIKCGCEVCRSADPRDRRLRASATVETAGGRRLLIDCGPDFREQMLRAGSPELDALLVTHTHYDHVGGIDDLRPYSYGLEGGFPIYCTPDVAANLRTRMPYCFRPNPYPGIPSLGIHEIDPAAPFSVAGVEVTPLPVMHLHLPIVGYRIGSLAYITDAKEVPETTLRLLEGVDTLVINALRHDPHPSHMSLSQALELIGRIAPRRAYLTHLSHQMGRHADIGPSLPAGVALAYDGLQLDIPG